jgi:hypothetical protein
MRFVRFAQQCCAALLCVPASACAFDVISIRQEPASFEPISQSAQVLTLTELTRVPLGEGFATPLKMGSNWRQVGRIQQGDVFHTMDQVVAVEASNQHEADIVVNRDEIVGFYLIVEHTFTAAARPVAIKSP